MSSSLTVHLRVNDSTGKPTACRLRITDRSGRSYLPLGFSTEIPLGRNEDVGGRVRLRSEIWAFIDGSCEIVLPTQEPLTVEIRKGIEYQPVRQDVTLGAGRMALRFSIDRWADERSLGWLAGDARAHFLSPHAALLEAACEDLAFVNLLAAKVLVPGFDGTLYPCVPNLVAFSGSLPALVRPGHEVIVNTFNRHPVLGSLGLLNSHRPIFPLTSGEEDDTDDWSLIDWAEQCRRKHGLVVWTDPFRIRPSGLSGGEGLIAALLGKIDAFEIAPDERSLPILPAYYRLLNAGVRLPLVGSSAKQSNRELLGSFRTYAYTGDGRTYGDWIEAIRRGATFVTNGPLLHFDIDSTLPGGRIHRAEDAVPMQVHATARSLEPFDRLEVVADGEVIAQAEPTGPNHEATLAVEYRPEYSGWLAARCRSLSKSGTGGTNSFAHTSPIVIEVPGRVSPRRPEAFPFLRQSVEEVAEWARSIARFSKEQRRTEHLERCQAALDRLNRNP